MASPTGRPMLAMFPGQGSQYVGMGKVCLAEFPYTKAVFEEAEDGSGASLRRLCFEGPDADLKLTANTQPCILTVSNAVWTVLQRECSIRPEMFAGHSLGEYSALVASGRLTLGRAAFLVRKRGEAMQRAVPQGTGAMAAVLNFDEAKLAQRCKETSGQGTSGRNVVEIVNFNSPQQLVVAGHTDSIAKLLKVLESEDKVKAITLPVSAPFHSSLMEPARKEMDPILKESPFVENGTMLIPNVTGIAGTTYETENLIRQIDSPVRWAQTLKEAGDKGALLFLEVGPGRVLFGLGRRQIPKDGKLAHSDDIVASVKEFSLL